MLQREASPDRHVASEREEWNGTSAYWVSSSLCSIEIDALRAAVAVMLVLCVKKGVPSPTLCFLRK